MNGSNMRKMQTSSTTPPLQQNYPAPPPPPTKTNISDPPAKTFLNFLPILKLEGGCMSC